MNRTIPLSLCAGILVLLCASLALGDLDPLGDTFGTGAVQIDILSAEAVFDSTNLHLALLFADAISAPSLGADNSVIGFIDLDTDQDAATGVTSWQELFAPDPPSPLGDEFYVDIESESFHPGFVDVYDAPESMIAGTVPVNFASSSMSMTIPLALLGADDGLLNYGVVVGTFAEATDEFPNGTVPATSQPVPLPGAVLLGAIGLSFAGWQLRNRGRTCSV